jgi:hypothetical protein
MPFPEPETPLPAAIAIADEESITEPTIARPAASCDVFTNFQSLTRIFNHFHQDSMTYEIGRGNQSFSAPFSREGLRAQK